MPCDPKEAIGLDALAPDSELLLDLENQSLEQISRLRAHSRLELRAPVHLSPADTSAKDEFEIVGTLHDVSRGGCRIVLPGPLRVGDVYRMTIDSEDLSFPLVFARCRRCILVREDHFDCGLQFFTELVIPGRDSKGDDLLA